VDPVISDCDLTALGTAFGWLYDNEPAHASIIPYVFCSATLREWTRDLGRRSLDVATLDALTSDEHFSREIGDARPSRMRPLCHAQSGDGLPPWRSLGYPLGIVLNDEPG